MERHELEELHYITHVGNLASICARGLLSHKRAARIRHHDVSLAEVQDRRRSKRVPGGRPLHEYVNVYITARNPMLYKRVAEGHIDALCVVRIAPAILDLHGVVMTDRNAAATYCRFRPPSEGLPGIEKELIERPYWTDGDALEQDRCKNAKFTEVLVPDSIATEHLAGVYVGSSAARATIENDGGCTLPVTINRQLFFR